MKVVISVAGRFRAFKIAGMLEKKGYLSKLYTTAPRRKSDTVSSEKICNPFFLNFLEFIEKVMWFIPFVRNSSMVGCIKKDLFDRFVAKKIKSLNEFDIFLGWNSSCLNSLKEAKKRGAVTLVEVGSAHPEFARKIYKEEYKLLGFNYPYKDDKFGNKILRKSLAELKSCDYIVVGSSFTEKSYLEQGFDRTRLIKVNYGVNLKHFHKIKKEDDVFRVVYCGYVSVTKGVQHLLQAFVELDLPNSELIIIGFIGKEMRGFLDKFKKSNINVLGPKQQDSLYKLYSAGSVLVQPSIQDGFSNVVPEAMACGLPVIVTSNVGAADIVRQGTDGFVIPIRDVDALKKKILYLYKNRKICAKMGKHARERVKEFTLDKYINRLIKEYKKAMYKKK